MLAVYGVVFARGFVPEAEVGSGGGEVEVEDFDFGFIGELDGDLLVAGVLGSDFTDDGEAGDDGVGLEGAGIGVFSEELGGEEGDLVGVDLLEEDDVWVPSFQVFDGVSSGEVCAVDGGDADDLRVLRGGLAGGLDDGVGEVGEGFCLVHGEGERDGPEGGDDEGEGGAEEAEGEDGEDESEAAPEPDGEDGEGGEGVRLFGVAPDGEDVSEEGRANEGPSDDSSGA